MQPTRRAAVASLSLIAATPTLAAGPRRPAVAEASDAYLTGRSGGSLFVARGGRVLWSGAVGSAPGAPTPPADAAYDGLSIGKTFTALAVLALADAGKLDIERRVRAYLPELPENMADIRVRHLLNNDTGLPDYLAGDDMTPKTATAAMAEIVAMKPDRKAGTGWRYSNVNFILLGLLVERIAGQPFEAAMRRLVLAPAGLSRTDVFGSPRWAGAAVAEGYVDGKAAGSPRTWPNTWNLLGSGGLATTPAELYRLNRTFMAGRRLSPLMRAVLLNAGTPTYGRSSYLNDDTLDISYGAGLFHWIDRKGRHVHYHGGDGDYGFAAVMYWRQEDDLFLALMTNSQVEGREVDRSVLMTRMLETLG